MKPALIDTDILSELFRAKHPHVQTRAAAYLTSHGARTGPLP